MIQIDKNTGILYFEGLALSSHTTLEDVLSFHKNPNIKIRQVGERYYTLESVNYPYFFIHFDLLNNNHVNELTLEYSFTGSLNMPFHIREKSRNELIKIMNLFNLEKWINHFIWGYIHFGLDPHYNYYKISICYKI